MIAFRERSPLAIGAIGIAVIAALLVAAFKVEHLPLIGGGHTYAVAFSEASGLKSGDEVRIAGVKVGKVTSVDLAGDHVRVEVRLDRGVALGSQTGASIRIKTILGQKFLSLEPAGTGRLAPGSEIPLSRTVSAYDVVEAFSDLSTTVEAVDTVQLAEALDVLAETFEDSPEEVQASLRGLSRLSQTVASRDAELRELLGHAAGVSQVLSERNEELVTLVRQGDLLLREIEKRREVIHQLLVSTAALAEELTRLVQENREQIQPALQQLQSVVEVLQRNQANIERTAELMAVFVRVFANTLGTGPWFDTYVQNLVPIPGSVESPAGQGG